MDFSAGHVAPSLAGAVPWRRAGDAQELRAAPSAGRPPANRAHLASHVTGAPLALSPIMTRSLALLLLAACGGAPPVAAEKPGPRGLRADQHFAMAEREDQRATLRGAGPGGRPGAGGGPGARRGAGAW